MNCTIVTTETRIAPFLDPVGETPVANRPLREWQEQAIRRAGLALVPEAEKLSGPCVILPDNLFVSAPLLIAFVAELRKAPPTKPTAMRVVRSSMIEENKALQGLANLEIEKDHKSSADFPLLYVPEGQTWTAGFAAESNVEIEPKERVFALEVPEHYFGRTRLAWPMTSMCAMVLRHWSHIVRLNMAAQAVEALDSPWWRRTLWMLWAVLRSVVPTKARVLRRMSRVGKGCNIHPTAVVEASVIEDGVTIGPHAVVTFSRIGKGSWIQEMSKVSLSVVGEHCMVSSGTMVNSCMLYPQASASQRLMQLCALGRRSITTGGGFMMDMVFEGEQKIPFDGETQSLGSRFLGSAVGHDTKLGTGFWLAPGRVIPNGVTIVRHPDDVLRSIPQDVEPGTTMVVKKGRLVPIDEC